MERSDTLPLFSENEETYPLFEEIIHNSSFNDRLNSEDIREILSSSDDQSDNSSCIGMWNNLDKEVLLENVFHPQSVVSAKVCIIC